MYKNNGMAATLTDNIPCLEVKIFCEKINKYRQCWEKNLICTSYHCSAHRLNAWFSWQSMFLRNTYLHFLQKKIPGKAFISLTNHWLAELLFISIDFPPKSDLKCHLIGHTTIPVDTFMTWPCADMTVLQRASRVSRGTGFSRGPFLLSHIN